MPSAKITAYSQYANLSDGVPVPLTKSYSSREDFMTDGAKSIKSATKAVLVAPLHVYNHSGISYSIDYSGQYADQWDSGTCGFVYITKEGLREHFGVKRLTADHLAQAEDLLRERVGALNEEIYLSEIYEETVANDE